MTSTVPSVPDIGPPVANRTNGHTDPVFHDATDASRSTTDISLRQAALASGLGLLSSWVR